MCDIKLCKSQRDPTSSIHTCAESDILSRFLLFYTFLPSSLFFFILFSVLLLFLSSFLPLVLPFLPLSRLITFFLFSSSSLRSFFPQFVPFWLRELRRKVCERPLVTPLYRPLSLPCTSHISVLLTVLLTVDSFQPPFYLSSSVIPCLSPPLTLYISQYYCIPTARISEMKSTLLLSPYHPPSSALPSFPAAAKSLAGLLRRQKFNIAVTLRWLYVLTVSLSSVLG